MPTHRAPGEFVDSGHERTEQHYHQVADRLASAAADHASLSIVPRSMVAHAYELGHQT
ncbi:hypothetical protein ACFY2H_37725 [Streptomyces griseofuscus]|uniref:hypothetical protein n=1 Tax=Streptomyces griseofuscus TaxID=146922 RepID=UPI00369F01BC